MKTSIGHLMLSNAYLRNLFTGEWFTTLWMSSLMAGYWTADNFHSDKRARAILSTSLHSLYMMPFDQRQETFEKWCCVCISVINEFISKALKWDSWSITSQFILPKHDIHFDRATLAASLSTFSQEQNQVYKLTSYSITNTYIDTLFYAGPI